jgi:HEAT repeat protein
VEEEAADVPELVDPWDFLDAGNEAEALDLFEGAALDMAGRDRVRELLMSTDPKEVVLACKIARLTNWRSLVMNLRRFLGHADTNVRREVVVTLGALAGPSMTHFVQRLEKDPSPEVRDAVAAALLQLDANG